MVGDHSADSLHLDKANAAYKKKKKLKPIEMTAEREQATLIRAKKVLFFLHLLLLKALKMC